MNLEDEIRRNFYLQEIPVSTTNAFMEHFKAHPEVWKAFENFTLRALEAGKKLGAKAVMERVRWEIAIERGIDFKVNNNFTAYFARVFEIKHPKHTDAFDKRAIRGLEDAI